MRKGKPSSLNIIIKLNYKELIFAKTCMILFTSRMYSLLLPERSVLPLRQKSWGRVFTDAVKN